MANNSVWINLDNGGQEIATEFVGPAASNIATPPFTFVGDLTSGVGSSAAGTVNLVSGGTSRLSVSASLATFDVPVTINKLALATTSTRGLLVQNTTAATALATVQISPRTEWLGTAWDTAASESVAFFAETLPATAATPTGIFQIGYSLNGGAATYPLSLTSAGALSVLGRVETASFFSVPGSTGYRIRSGAIVNGGAINLFNSGETTGVGFDAGTNSVLKIRTTAQTGYATVDALAYQRSGVILIAGTAPAIASGFGASPSIAASNGSNVFTINVGTGGAASSGVITLPTAPTGWVAFCNDLTNNAASVTAISATTATTITLQNYSRTLGTAVAWTASDIVQVIAFPY